MEYHYETVLFNIKNCSNKLVSTMYKKLKIFIYVKKDEI